MVTQTQNSPVAHDEPAASDWDTALYLKFENERTQPARDLLARLRLEARRIVDLGCGPGQARSFWRRAIPAQKSSGLDNSEQMLARRAGAAAVDRFRKQDIAAWRPVR